MTLFKNNTHKELWRQRWCETCFQPDEAARRIQGKDTQCPIWEQAIRTGRKPQLWDRTRSDEMEKSIRCNAYDRRPALTKMKMPPNPLLEDVPLFDIEPHETHLVPVEGWPDRPTKNGVDHA